MTLQIGRWWHLFARHIDLQHVPAFRIRRRRRRRS
jgi:hypothetical protein